MRNKENSRSTIINFMSWGGVVLITALAFFCNYYYNFSGSVKSILWICWLSMVLLLGYTTTQGKETLDFAKESKIELQKVVWPSRQEAVQISIIVVIMVCITGLLLWGIDTSMMWVIGKVTHLS